MPDNKTMPEKRTVTKPNAPTKTAAATKTTAAQSKTKTAEDRDSHIAELKERLAQRKEAVSKGAVTAKSTQAPKSKDSATASKPAVAASKPAATASKPAATASKPAATASKLAATASKPAAMASKPAVAASKPAAKPKTEKAESESKENFWGKAVAVTKYNAKRYAIVFFTFLFMVLTVSIMIMRSCSAIAPDGPIFVNEFATTTKAGYHAEYGGTVKRNIPTETKNEGYVADDRYPVFGYSVRNITAEEKNGLLVESRMLIASGTREGGAVRVTDWNRMDSEGKLYFNSEPTLDAQGNQRSLYKHTASQNMWYGEVSDDEPAIVKTITIQSRAIGNHITGLYAPAGEVVKIVISEADMATTGGIVVDIGQAFPVGKSNNIWAARNDFSRMPIILNTMAVNTTLSEKDENGNYVTYVGSFLGGPIYVKPAKAGTCFTLTISGAVAYEHYILGATSEEEFERNKNTSTPYFDLEVYDRGVRISGGKKYAKKTNGTELTYQDLYDVSIYWQKVMSVSTQFPTGSSTGTGIVYLYEPFVAAGSLVAFVGNNVVNAPPGYMSNALDYNAMVTYGYDALWGNMHELNHHFQSGWGLPAAGEVSNNSVSLVEYSMFTKISSLRKLGNASEGSYGCGWDNYTNPSWSLRTALSRTSANAGLDAYSTLLHNLGQDMYIKAAQQRGGQSFQAYCNAWTAVTGLDMTYYFNNVLHGGVAESDGSMPVFIPAATIYQTGRSVILNGEKTYITTAQPYEIAAGTEFTVDLREYNAPGGMYSSGSMVLPSDIRWEITKVSGPEYGKLSATDEKNVYTYMPDEEHELSGKITVTLSVTGEDGTKYDDIDLVLEFHQSYEMNKTMLQRSTYIFNESDMYESAADAFEANYAGYTEMTDTDNANPTQNSNTDIWYTEQPPANSVSEVRGKIYADDTAKYRLAFRGRWNCALYISLDEGKTYELAGKIEGPTSGNGTGTGFASAPYVDLELEAGSWVYFKEVMLNNWTNRGSFFGLGWGKFTTPLFTTREDEEGVIHYYNASGQEVDADVAINAQPTVSVSYATAYRSSYKFTDAKFYSENYYPKSYTVNYSDNKTYAEGFSVIDTNYSPWTSNVEEGRYDLSHLVDNDAATDIHTHQSFYVSANNLFYVTLDLGKELDINGMTLYGFSASNAANIGMPSHFKLYASEDGEEFEEIASFENQKRSGKNLAVAFEEIRTRYVKFEVSGSDNGRVALSGISFAHNFALTAGKQYALGDGALTFRGGWSVQYVFSSFGHVYAAGSGATLDFECEGTRVGLYSVPSLGSSFEVYIDGNKCDSQAVKDGDDSIKLVYLSPELSEGKHKVRVVCKGRANIDSVAVW